MKFIGFLINSNIYVALGAVFLTLESQVLLGMVPQINPLLFVLFFGVMLDYNFHRLVTLLWRKEDLANEKYRWVRENRDLFYTMTILAFLGFIWSVSMLNVIALLVVAPFALITFFYSIPVVKINKKSYRLRDIPLLKLFLVAIVWSVLTVLLPVVQANQSFEVLQIGLILLERFLFAFAITLPFDIRDMQNDRLDGVITIPMRIGVERSTQLTNVILVLFVFVALVHYGFNSIFFVIPALILSSLVTLFFVNLKSLRSSKFYYNGILDGSILIQGALVMISYYIWFLLLCH